MLYFTLFFPLFLCLLSLFCFYCSPIVLDRTLVWIFLNAFFELSLMQLYSGWKILKSWDFVQVIFSVMTQTNSYFLILNVQKKKTCRPMLVCVDLHLNKIIHYMFSSPSSCSRSYFIFTEKFWIKVSAYIQVTMNVASSGVNYWGIYFFFFPEHSFFCLFRFSSCLVPPLWCSFYWNSNGSRVCVASKSRNWTHLPLSACGTKPWPHSSTAVKRFYYVP